MRLVMTRQGTARDGQVLSRLAAYTTPDMALQAKDHGRIIVYCFFAHLLAFIIVLKSGSRVRVRPAEQAMVKG